VPPPHPENRLAPTKSDLTNAPPNWRIESNHKTPATKACYEHSDETRIKTAQSLLRHANPSITMGTYTHAITGDKRQAQSKSGRDDSAAGKCANRGNGEGYGLMCTALCTTPFQQVVLSC
jgi:hypothetical protein